MAIACSSAEVPLPRLPTRSSPGKLWLVEPLALLPATLAVASCLGSNNALSLMLLLSIPFLLLPASSPRRGGRHLPTAAASLLGTRLPVLCFGSKKQEGKLESASQVCHQPQHPQCPAGAQHTWRKIIIKSPILFLAGWKRLFPSHLNVKVSF